MTQPLPHGYCIGCGYALQGLPASPPDGSGARYRCPECGRAFDPADAKTFRLYQHSRFVHWLATPIGWPMAIFSLLCGVGVLAASGWVPGTLKPSGVDLVYYFDPPSLVHRTNLVSVRDYVFVICVLAATAAMLWWVIRTVAARFAKRSLENVLQDQPTHLGRRHALMAFGLLMTSGGAMLGWPYRLARHWVAQLAAGSFRSPVNLSSDEAQATLRAAVIGLPKPHERMAGLHMLVENYPAVALPILTEAVSRERDADLRLLELRLIGLYRSPDSVDLLRGFLSGSDGDERAAAADAIGLVHAPAYDVPLPESQFGRAAGVVSGNDQIGINPLVQLHANPANRYPIELRMDATPLDGSVRSALETMMLASPTSAEREAAARALLAWPAEEYQLRLAEWGVWISDGGKLKLVQSVLDEIPAFVHRTGNPLSEFSGRINQLMVITKPILHITVDRPMAVDVNVLITAGRPWFAYPLPDDFAVRVDNVRMLAPAPTPMKPPLAVLDNPALAKLTDLRQGYPWMVPHHISDGPTGGAYFGSNELVGLGVRWQSIIASPTQLPWMTPPEVGTDPHFAWWRRLRDVPSAWLSSRGESERFLYYDGPTLSPAPADVTLSGNALRIECNNEEIKEFGNWRTPARHNQKPQGVLLIHHRNAQLTGQAITMPPLWDLDHPNADFTLADDNLHDAQVIDEFRKMLTASGLTAAEAEGLVAAWTPQFFQTDGTRVLFIMSKEDYDAPCPILVRPTPTELVRVGIVLTEL